MQAFLVDICGVGGASGGHARVVSFLLATLVRLQHIVNTLVAIWSRLATAHE